MGCAEAGVEGGIGFEDKGGDVLLGEEDGEKEARRAGADDEDLLWGFRGGLEGGMGGGRTFSKGGLCWVEGEAMVGGLAADSVKERRAGEE